jgi:rRNA processing protein Krr1/Pno1
MICVCCVLNIKLSFFLCLHFILNKEIFSHISGEICKHIIERFHCQIAIALGPLDLMWSLIENRERITLIMHSQAQRRSKVVGKGGRTLTTRSSISRCREMVCGHFLGVGKK